MRSAITILLASAAIATHAHARPVEFYPSPSEVDFAARVAWGEMRGQRDAEVQGVCHVMLNRMRQKYWGKTVEDVAKAPRQFSALNKEDVNRNKLLSPSLPAKRSYKRVRAICDTTFTLRLKGVFSDPTNCADHYWSGPIEPWWVKATNRRRAKRGLLELKVTRIGRSSFVSIFECPKAPDRVYDDPMALLIAKVAR